MAVYTRRTRVDAPLEEVWDFHSTVEGLTAVTPGFVNLRVEAVRTPDGGDGETLVEGTEIDVSVRPFGVGPRQTWTTTIVERVREDDVAWFRDEMTGGTFSRWVHTHRFEADGDATVLSDRVEYVMPGGPVGSVAAQFAKVGLGPMFRHRHRETKALLE